MQTQHRTMRNASPQEPETGHHRRTHVLIAIAAVVALAAAGLAIWALAGTDDEASDPQLETVTELVDTMHKGLNERNLEGVRSVFTEDATVNSTSVSTAYAQASALSNFERVSEVAELGELEPGSDYYLFVQQFESVESEDLIRAPLLIELDGDLLSQAEWVPDLFSLTD
jgi:hypothetical protein